MGFVFYDTETTGTNLDFDQILQFAAIHTDHDLVELDRFEIRCRLLPIGSAGGGRRSLSAGTRWTSMRRSCGRPFISVCIHPTSPTLTATAALTS